MRNEFLRVGDVFERVGESIYTAWDRDDPRHLSAAAAAALRTHRATLLELSPTHMLQWALRGDLPTQSWSNDFGDPALTVLDRPDFRIDLLYWDHNASPTHKHVSCGAFLAHHGDRLHQRFSFHPHDRVDEFVSTGDLIAAPREAMNRGEIIEIRPELIHDLFWLKRPSVTISVRCTSHPGVRQRPNEFWGPGLEVLDMSHHGDSLVARQIASMRLLSSASPRLFASEVSSAVTEGAPILAYQSMVLLAELGYRAGDAILDPIRLSNERGDELGKILSLAFDHFARKLELGGIYTADRAAQIMVALLWAGASADESRTVMETYMPDVPVPEAARQAIDIVSRADATVADIVRSRSRGLGLLDALGPTPSIG